MQFCGLIEPQVQRVWKSFDKIDCRIQRLREIRFGRFGFYILGCVISTSRSFFGSDGQRAEIDSQKDRD